MTQLKVGIIGCGRPRQTEGATGFGQGHLHAMGYKAVSDCVLAAAADIRPDNLELFCQEHNIPNGYLDYKEMLAKEELDIVSVCLWPHLHAPVVIDAAQAGVKAIHAEKPMAPTWGEAKKMVAVCEENHVQLTINHQRRCGQPFRKAKELVDAGAIGQLLRLEGFCPNLFDWGTHWFDMMFFYNNETPAKWVIGQLDARGGPAIFGVRIEGQGLSYIEWQNGVHGLLVTGRGDVAQQDEMTMGNRLVGTEGIIEVGAKDGPLVRLRSPETGGRWQAVDMEGTLHGNDHVMIGIVDLVDALKNGREPELSGRRALQATELIFATYESSRKRGRVDLPLEIEDSPLLSMLEAGVLETGN
jgi:predicted dehydrogenase